MRKLRFHEQKLLKKVDFIDWELDNNVHEAKVMRRFQLKSHDEYTTYNKLSREVRDLARRIKELDPKDPFRVEASRLLIDKLYTVGLVPSRRGLDLCDAVTASSFCRRRLPVLMVRTRMAPNVATASRYVEHGHVRVGPEMVNDPAYLVPRSMEDFVTWTDHSKIRRHVLDYNGVRDDYDLEC